MIMLKTIETFHGGKKDLVKRSKQKMKLRKLGWVYQAIDIFFMAQVHKWLKKPLQISYVNQIKIFK